jgi:hypothetical protein
MNASCHFVPTGKNSETTKALNIEYKSHIIEEGKPVLEIAGTKYDIDEIIYVFDTIKSMYELKG